MEEGAVVLIANLIILFYNLTWLVFLVQKHYGQVTTRAGHIFELNLQLQNTINTFLWTLLEYSRALDGWCTLRDILDGILFYGPWIAIAGSQIETAIFLKTLDVNTMMTNTAGKIILAMTIFTYGYAIIFTVVLPDRTMCQNRTELFEYLNMTDIYQITAPNNSKKEHFENQNLSKEYNCNFMHKQSSFIRYSIPSTIVLVIILLVLGFTVFRSHQMKNKRVIKRPENVRVEGTGRLFTVRRAMNELQRGSEGNQVSHEENLEDDIVVEDIEFMRIETPHISPKVKGGNASQGELFTVQRAINELQRGSEGNQLAPAENLEDDIVVEDIELVRIETPQHSSEQVSIGMMIGEISQLQNTESNWNDRTENQQSQCLPGMGVMMQILNKYFKNTLLSLLILTSELPWYVTVMYGFITNSGCENPTFMLMSEISFFGIIVFNFCSPFLIKLKLDRLSQ